MTRRKIICGVECEETLLFETLFCVVPLAFPLQDIFFLSENWSFLSEMGIQNSVPYLYLEALSTEHIWFVKVSRSWGCSQDNEGGVLINI